MAELAEVEQVLVATIAQAVYPDGTAAASATGTPVRIYRGWPQPGGLDADLANKIVNISVYSLDVERNLTRTSLDWQELPQPPVNLTLTVDGNTITVGGEIGSPLNAAVLVNGRAFIYPLQASDTPTGVATALAALIGTAASSGPIITVPGGAKLEARIGTVGLIVLETRRQIKSFRIGLWCPSPMARDTLAAVVDSALSSLTYITLPDGTAGRIRYVQTHSDDSGQKAMRYRRDLVYTVEYSTTETVFAPAVVVQDINIAGGNDPSDPSIETVNV